jgi:hypothetical protein
MSRALADQVQQLYDKCKEFPETGAANGSFTIRAEAYMALIELRNLCPGIVLALEASARSGGQLQSGISRQI